MTVVWSFLLGPIFISRMEYRYIRRSPLSLDTDIAESPELFSNEVDWLPDFVPNQFFKIPKEYKLNGHPKYLDGRVIGMDAASVATVWALQIDQSTKQDVLDMCCAPGMKLMVIKDRMCRDSQLVGTDVSENRLRVCRKLMIKYGYSEFRGLFLKNQNDGEIVPFDKIVEQTKSKKKRKLLAKRQKMDIMEVPKQFDRVLVDAECTHDGSDRHESKHEGFWTNADTVGVVKNRVYYDTDDKINQLIENQKKLICEGFDLLAQNGLLVYSTCSLQSRQNEEVVEYLLEKFKGTAQLVELPFKLVEDGGNVPARRVFGKCCLFDPATSGTSGQFIACIRKH